MKFRILFLLEVLIMGTGNLPDLAAAPTKVEATTDQYNAVTNALQGHQVMRETDGTVVDDTYDIGRPSSGRPRKIYVGTGINVNGSDIDFTSNTFLSTGINSGKSKDSGFPDFLTPLGATGGAENTFTIEAADTNLEVVIAGEIYILEADLESDDLALAPSSNNTCTVNDSNISGDPEFSKTIGEFGYYISIDAVGSEIEDLGGTVQCFKVNNGSETEVFIASVETDNTGETNRLIPILRGIGGTDRIAFSDNDTITLLKAHYIFLDNDLATIDTTTNYPIWSATEPTAPDTGDYWWDVANEVWKRYSGASWETLGRIYLGYAICDESDCLYVEHEDFNLAWNDFLQHNQIRIADSTHIQFEGEMIHISVAGNTIKTNEDIIHYQDSLASGEAYVANRWYYIYITNEGQIYTSLICPRKLDAKKGWYHPQQYWRCISLFYGETSCITNFVYIRDTGVFSFNAIDTYTLNDTPAGVLNSFDIPPLVMHIEWRLANGTDYSGVGDQDFKLYLTDVNDTAIGARELVNDEYIASGYKINMYWGDYPLIRNTLVNIQDYNFINATFAIVAFYLKF